MHYLDDDHQEASVRPDVRQFAQLAGLEATDRAAIIPWDRSLEVAAINFPADYQEFLDFFGPGAVRGDLGVAAPWPRSGLPGGSDGFASMLELTTNDIGLEFKAMREESFDLCPYPIYPEPGGLLVWAGNHNGDLCFWLTENDDLSQWPVIVWLRDKFPDAWRRYEMGMVEFLLLILSNEEGELTDLAFRNSESRAWVSDDTDS